MAAELPWSLAVAVHEPYAGEFGVHARQKPIVPQLGHSRCVILDGCAAPVELAGPLCALLGLEVVLLAELHQATLLDKLIEDLGHLVAQPSSVSLEILDKEVCDDRCMSHELPCRRLHRVGAERSRR